MENPNQSLTTETQSAPSTPPAAPRPKIVGLPGEDNGESGMLPELTFDDDDSGTGKLSTSQLYELNQALLEESVPLRPLIDEVAPMSALRAEYENGSPSFVKQIDWLTQQGYASIRRTRGDGDCFYRSIAFAYVDRLMNDPERDLAVAKAISLLESTTPLLKSVGFQSLIFEDFYGVLLSLIRSIVEPNERGQTLTPKALLEAFQEPQESNSIVMYLRLLTSAQIRLDPESFDAFLMHPDTAEPIDSRSFCENFVEACGKEADHVQITALCRVLQLNVDVAYLDGRQSDGTVQFVNFRCDPNERASPLLLLYRPGHYDILSKK